MHWPQDCVVSEFLFAEEFGGEPMAPRKKTRARRAADILGINRGTLRKKLKTYGLAN